MFPDSGTGQSLIMLSLGSIELDLHVLISESLYKGIILLLMYRRISILEPRPDRVITITVL